VTWRVRSAESISSSSECDLCGIAVSKADLPNPYGEYVMVAYVDEQAVVLVCPHLDGVLVLVAPRQHVNQLSDLPEHSLPHFLAALRRTAESVRAVFRASRSVIEPWETLPARVGHVCFSVEPNVRDELIPNDPTRNMTRARQLVESLEGPNARARAE